MNRPSPWRCPRTGAALIALGLTGLLLFTLPLVRADPDVPAGDKPAPRPLYRIAKETTFITEPLTLDGRPDYLAWLNKTYGEGVTPENNAFVVYIAVLGQRMFADAAVESVLQHIGLDTFPDGPRLAEFDEAMRSRLSDNYDDPRRNADDPRFARFLKANQLALDAIVAASTRDRYFSPLVCIHPNGLMIGSLMPALATFSHSAHLLIIRANHSARDGELGAARRDLTAVGRMGSHLGQSLTFIEALSGTFLRRLALTEYQRLATEASLSAGQFAALLGDLDSLPPMSPLWRIVDRTERVQYLDAVVHAAINPDSLGDEVDEKLRDLLRGDVDWDQVLVDGNAMCNRLIEAMKTPSLRQRQIALDRFDDEMIALKQQTDPLQPTQTVSARLRLTFVAKLTTAQRIADRTTVDHLLARIAFQLAAHRARYGEYPQKVADLDAYKDAGPPVDPFSEKPLVYKRTDGGFILYSVGSDGEDDGGVDDYETGDMVVERKGA